MIQKRVALVTGVSSGIPGDDRRFIGPGVSRFRNHPTRLLDKALRKQLRLEVAS
ncbi:MAG: hypothetical protein MOB07_13855 [Acidobacteria bacterium]|nr:hypothetical protein [Acidobacteriota bacterium]